MKKHAQRDFDISESQADRLLQDIIENKDEDIKIMGMTSFFKVTNEDKLDDIISHIDADVLVVEGLDGDDFIFSLIAHDSISYCVPLDVPVEDMEDYDGEMISTWRLLQDILPEGKEIIMQSLLYSKMQDEILVEVMRTTKNSIGTESKIRKIGSDIVYEGIDESKPRGNDTVEKLLNAIFTEDDTKYIEMTNFFEVTNEIILDEIIKRIPSQVIVLKNRGKVSILAHDALGDCIPLDVEEDKIEEYEGSYHNTFDLMKGIIPDGEVIIINSLSYSKQKNRIEPGFSIITKDKTETI